jgi:hypothetical protein
LHTHLFSFLFLFFVPRALLYFGAFHRMHSLLRHGGSETLRARGSGGEKEVLSRGIVGKRGGDGALKPLYILTKK